MQKNDVIYLVRGAEITAENIKITENNIHYSIKSKAVGIKGLIGKGSVAETVLAKSEVFMIRNRSGMSDIITPVENTEVNKPDNILPSNPQAISMAISIAVKSLNTMHHDSMSVNFVRFVHTFPFPHNAT